MIQVPSLAHFSSNRYIQYFSGKTLDDAITLAHEWSQRAGAHLVSYFVQPTFGGRTILVSYECSPAS